ncbi:hypothetical protein ACFW1A_07705 [Kitasatospora sp. NPDC058965]|uniref:hypothetical protein n=1 Tax=Kitasatospora sp. NPDC058965 TaxID=3346682 RepID=UPI00367FA7DF
MQHPECGDQRLTAEGEVAVARLALHEGDLAHAANHVADAMVADPQLPEVHEVLAELWGRAGGPAAARELFPLTEQQYLGTVVCRAQVEAAAGDVDQAVLLLASAVRFAPEAPWCAVAWLGAPELPGRLDPETLAQAVTRVNGGLPDRVPEPQRAVLRPFEQLVRAATALHPEHTLLTCMASALVRRLGDPEEAVRLAEHAQRVAPGHMPAVMLGNALRAAGRPEQALAVWETQLAEQFDGYLAVDVAELYAALGRPEAGLPWLERTLAAEPDHPKAGPALHGLRHRIDGGTRHLLALNDHFRAHPDHEYAPALLAELSRREPWLGVVHPAVEATVNLIHQFQKSPKTHRDDEIACTSSQLEPPSSRLALALAFPRATIEYQSVPDPDPRLTLREVSTWIWEFDGTTAVPAVAPPSAAGAELIRSTTEIAWPTLSAAYDHAVRLAGLPLADLLGALAHPPAPREDELGRALLGGQPELWVRAVQAFACLGIAHLRTEQPWLESQRREVLVDLLLGSEDWVAEAAGFALVAVAWTHPETREDVAARLLDRLLDVAECSMEREVTILQSVCALMLCCPWLDERGLGLARDLAARDRAQREQVTPQDEQTRRQVTERAAQLGGAGPQPPAAPPAGQSADRPGRLGKLFRRR